MGPTSEPDIDTLVVGGGLAGLVAATTAARAGGRTVLLEPHPLGGRARVDERSGFRFNRGPRALYLGGAGRPALEALGVDLSAGGAPALGRAMARRDGRLHRLPSGPMSLLRTSLLRPGDKVRLAGLLARLPKVDAPALSGTTFAAYLADQRLSPVAADLVRMLARVATYAADLDDLDAGALVAQLQLALAPGVRYLDGGFQSLVDQLRAAAWDAGVEVRPVAARAVLPAGADGAATVEAVDHRLQARTVVLATGTPSAAEALLGAPLVGADHLSPPVTAACLELGLRRPPAHPVVFGVGEPLYLSTHCPPALLAPPGQVVVHLMRNHAAGEALDAKAQRAWLRSAAAEAGVAEADVAEERFLAEMVVTGGLPTAQGGGLSGRPEASAADRPGVLLAGDWVGPVGLLADAAIASGAEAGRQAARRAATMAVA
ncbi:NAD(P)-binding protein [Aquihabitans sp. G128]|uniref:NAD(P)-binding protein n=1 Tax=Aquihabitans sp. G128 TaxID=2849779 RepID=UPI001C24EE7E|nr:NAD(P)-binding protein [Aquihabitans sp. G128]QXC60336.1 NAD(P)-binding protein [Aquihabitans sp. G128]